MDNTNLVFSNLRQGQYQILRAVFLPDIVI